MHKEIEKAIEAIERGVVNCVPLSERRGATFSDEDVETVMKAGLRILWTDTFKGGCWHITK